MRRAPQLPAAAVALTLAAGAAAAQQGASGVTGLHEADDGAMLVQPFNLSVDRIEDMDLYAPAGEEIGEIEDVLVDAAGKPVAVTADVGGFLGIGDRTVVIGLDQVRLDGERLTTGMTKQQIEALPARDD